MERGPIWECENFPHGRLLFEVVFRTILIVYYGNLYIKFCIIYNVNDFMYLQHKMVKIGKVVMVSFIERVHRMGWLIDLFMIFLSNSII